jgi:glucosamine--fructose-6-phosphate aminotransferase (isomerizing)
MIGQKKGTISGSNFYRLLNELDAIPDKVQKVLAKRRRSNTSPDIYKDATNALYLGGGTASPWRWKER